jgi:hypothetical protein
MNSDLGDKIVEYDGVFTAIKDIPSSFLRALFGYGHLFSHGREVLPGEWRFTPETCPTSRFGGTWIDRKRLACAGCGLDCT